MYSSLLALALLSFSSGHGQPPKYAVTDKWPVGGEGGWDCMRADSAARRLYVPRGTHVMVLDLDSGKLIGDLLNTNGVHDVAIVSKAGKGYTSNGRDNTVTVFDLATLKETGTIPVGQRPDVMVYDKASNRVFTFNGGSSDATAIDPSTDKVVGTVKLDGRPEFPAADGHGIIFVNIEDKSEIQSFDTKSLATIGSWSLAPGEAPTGLAMDTKHHRLYSSCDNDVMAVSDYRLGKLIATPGIGKGPDGALYDAKWDLAFSSNGQDGTLSILHPERDGTFSTVTIPTQSSARTMALDTKTHRIFLAAAQVHELNPPVEGRRREIVPGSFIILVVAPVKS
jgi:YVTN family beta-propeller protein